MNRSFTHGVVILMVGICLAPSVSAQQPPLATMDELRQMYDAGHYRTCLQQIARVMPQVLSGAPGYDRDALVLMRANCLLHLDDGASARQAYQSAESAPEEAQWARGRAMVFLISQSPKLKYTPREGGQPIDIKDDKLQADAMKALLADQLAATQGQVRRATTAQNLEPIIDIMPRMQDLYALELSATGKTEQVDPILRQIGQHARDLISREIDELDERMQAVRDSTQQAGGAQVMGQGGAWWVDPGIVRRGLTPQERQWLRETIGYGRRIAETAEKGQRLSARLGGEADAWGELVNRARQVGQNAQQILDME